VDARGATVFVVDVAVMLDDGMFIDDDDDDDDKDKEEEEEEEEGLDDNEDKDDGNAVVADTEKVPLKDGDDDIDAIAVGPASPSSRLRAESPQVCGATASLDVISNVDVFPELSPSGSSSCMWQIPWL